MRPVKQAVLAIDQGTTSSRAMLFDENGSIIAQQAQTFPQYYPADGAVEHDPEDIWQSVLKTSRAMIKQAESRNISIIGIGITNQRETALVWERETGKPIHNAIVWQDRRDAELCNSMKKQGLEEMVTSRSGLLLDPYFSATKIAWILDNAKLPGQPQAAIRKRAEAGELCFGTVDCYLLWQLTGGRVFATDATNASRTNLYNIHDGDWDDTLLELFNLPRAILPEIRNSADDFGTTDGNILGAELPVLAMIGDQQAAAFGQGCFSPGMIKATYGTGCFILVNSGAEPIRSKHRLLTTVAWQLEGQRCYALEGSIFIAGAVIQWLRDGLGILPSAAASEAMAKRHDSNRGVYLVPALTGLGAPWWDSNARGAIFGLTRDSSAEDLVRAGLESVAYQSHDLIRAISADGISPASLRVDGGMSENDWLMQFLADMLNMQVERPRITETTALGAAMLALMQYRRNNPDDAGQRVDPQRDDLWHTAWQQAPVSAYRAFVPTMTAHSRNSLLSGWHKAVQAVLD